MWVTQRGLGFRREHPEIFHRGSYVPLESSTLNQHLCSFARVWEQNGEKKVAIVAVPLFAYILMGGKRELSAEETWDDATIQLSPEAPAEFENIFTSERIHANDGALRCSDLFRHFPVCVLKGL